MKRHDILTGLILFLLGLTGVLSLLTMEIPLSDDTLALLTEQLTPEQIRWIMLLNPSILLLVATTIGTLLFRKSGLQVPVIGSLIKGERPLGLRDVVRYGLVLGLATGALLMLMSKAFDRFIPQDFIALSESLQPSLAARLLYGGITEELLVRFGLMGFVVWLLKQFARPNAQWVYFAGIVAAALVFALAHLPVAFEAVAEPSAILIVYILIGNSIGGIVYGWLYWKKGLESAMLAHMATHLAMVLIGLV